MFIYAIMLVKELALYHRFTEDFPKFFGIASFLPKECTVLLYHTLFKCIFYTSPLLKVHKEDRQ